MDIDKPSSLPIRKRPSQSLCDDMMMQSVVLVLALDLLGRTRGIAAAGT